MKTERPAGRGLYRPEIVRAMLSGHSILGIGFAALIYLVCLTGTISVFERDWERWEQPDAPSLSTVSDAAVARAVRAAEARMGAGGALYGTLPGGDLPRLSLLAYRGGESTVWIADAEGRLVADGASPWADFVTRLHLQLHLPRAWGSLLVGLTGVALLSSLLSGILSHPRIVRDAFHLRVGGARRLEQADLHNRLGVWALPFHLIVSLTGALLGLTTLIVSVLALLLYRGDDSRIYAMLYGPTPAADARAAAMPDIAALLPVARQRLPGATLRSFAVTNWGRRDARISVSAVRPRLLVSQDSVAFDANGRIAEETHLGGLTLGEKIVGALAPLHFGWFGGAAVRIAYGLLGLALCVVTSSGISIWLARRRDRRRPAPGLERIWAAVAWGQPLVLALTAAASLVAPTAALTPLWLGATILSLLIATALASMPAGLLARRLRIATGLAMLGTVALHLALRGAGGDSAAAAIDVGLALIGLALAAPLARPIARRHRLRPAHP